jgi:DNA-binding transcriptional regulator/RsmH inhibitor MraZ
MQQCVLDAQGRLTIGDDLLKYGELERGKDAVLVGLFTHFEIVKPDRWAEWQQRAELNYSDIASRAGF